MQVAGTYLDVKTNPDLDVEEMRRTATAVLARLAFPHQTVLASQQRALGRHLAALIPAVEALAQARPAESIPRADAEADAEDARTLLNTVPGPGMMSAVQHVKALARALRALLRDYDTLTGTRPLGAAS